MEPRVTCRRRPSLADPVVFVFDMHRRACPARAGPELPHQIRGHRLQKRRRDFTCSWKRKNDHINLRFRLRWSQSQSFSAKCAFEFLLFEFKVVSFCIV
ncbi:hypothetical protein EUGRSUZ_G03064 [Eucalyptus grandis]|uniref:Uncharacterized protein n=2 Tax=Eucalyptus grandis TaxID=71139 RepID=A0ACC3K8F9_EUCGR|nr:hypothetical protein EUGRSUZ_G03064 [Eucalyptus grandis]